MTGHQSPSLVLGQRKTGDHAPGVGSRGLGRIAADPGVGGSLLEVEISTEDPTPGVGALRPGLWRWLGRRRLLGGGLLGREVGLGRPK